MKKFKISIMFMMLFVVLFATSLTVQTSSGDVTIDLNEIVLAGDSGTSLAFGPGLSYAGASLEDKGIKLISGHRDTHFNKLQNININDAIFIKTPVSNKQYKVKDIGVVDSRNYAIDAESVNYDLVLSTCYPFNATSVGGVQRFIVGAIEL